MFELWIQLLALGSKEGHSHQRSEKPQNIREFYRISEKDLLYRIQKALVRNGSTGLLLSMWKAKTGASREESRTRVGGSRWFLHQKADMYCRPRKGYIPNLTPSWSGGGCYLLSHITENHTRDCTHFSVKPLKSKAMRWEQNVPGWSQLCSAWGLREGSPLGQKMKEKAILPEVSKEIPRGRRNFRNRSPYCDLQLLCPTHRNSF